MTNNNDRSPISSKQDPRIILQAVKTVTTELFGDNLVGLYVHGSLAFGCFRWEKSDIDYLAVIKRPLTLFEKCSYIDSLLRINQKSPPKGIEMSVVLEEHCTHFVHPTPYDLHFSNGHLERAANDLTAYCETMHGVDPDLAAHFTVTRAVGFSLCGKPIADVFAPVPTEAYLDSLRYDTENAAKDILENPIYVILNLCRVLAYVREHSVLSKAAGGEWGLTHLPAHDRDIVETALACYTSYRIFPTAVYRDRLPAFAKDMLKQIFGAYLRKMQDHI